MLQALCRGEAEAGGGDALLGGARLHTKVSGSALWEIQTAVNFSTLRVCQGHGVLMVRLASERSRHSSKYVQPLPCRNPCSQSTRMANASRSDGSSPASRIQHTRTPPSPHASRNYGRATRCRRTCWRCSSAKASR